MRRLLTSALAVTLLSGMARTALAGGPVWEFEGDHRPGNILVSPAAFLGRAADSPIAVEEPDSVPDTRQQPAPSQEPDSEEGQPGRFDNLWLMIVGVVGLLLVVQMVRIERRGRQQSNGPGSRNESGSSGVLTDE